MKEAASEANMTVIAVILIGAVAAVAIPLIGTMLENTAKRSCCNNAGGSYTPNSCIINGVEKWSTIWDTAAKKCL